LDLDESRPVLSRAPAFHSPHQLTTPADRSTDPPGSLALSEPPALSASVTSINARLVGVEQQVAHVLRHLGVQQLSETLAPEDTPTT
jgi:hypothetical protein